MNFRADAAMAQGRRSNERMLNEAVASAAVSNPLFVQWLLSHTPFSQSPSKLILARGDNPWSKSKIDGVESETDILLVFEGEAEGERFAIHIENKQPGDHLRPGQAARYKTRAAEWAGVQKWGDYHRFSTMILVPRTFFERYGTECSEFDCRLSYEDIGQFIPAFTAR